MFKKNCFIIFSPRFSSPRILCNMYVYTHFIISYLCIYKVKRGPYLSVTAALLMAPYKYDDGNSGARYQHSGAECAVIRRDPQLGP